MPAINAQTITDLVVLAIIVLALDAVFLYTISDMFSRQIMLVQGTALKVNMKDQNLVLPKNTKVPVVKH